MPKGLNALGVEVGAVCFDEKDLTLFWIWDQRLEAGQAYGLFNTD